MVKHNLPCQKNYLTVREKQCAEYLIDGKSVKEIAECLSLSPLTIEYYINNMKAKFLCQDINELIEAIKQNEVYFERS